MTWAKAGWSPCRTKACTRSKSLCRSLILCPLCCRHRGKSEMYFATLGAWCQGGQNSTRVLGVDAAMASTGCNTTGVALAGKDPSSAVREEDWSHLGWRFYAGCNIVHIEHEKFSALLPRRDRVVVLLVLS